MVHPWDAVGIIRQTCSGFAASMLADKGARTDTTVAGLTGARRPTFGGFGHGLKGARALHTCGLTLAPMQSRKLRPEHEFSP